MSSQVPNDQVAEDAIKKLMYDIQKEQYTWSFAKVSFMGLDVYLPKYKIEVSTKGISGKERRRETLYKFLPQQKR